MPPTMAYWYGSSQSTRTPNVGARASGCDARGIITSPGPQPAVLGAVVGGASLPRPVVQRRPCIQLRASGGCGTLVEEARHDAAIVQTRFRWREGVARSRMRR